MESISPVRIAPYDKAWPDHFRSEQERLGGLRPPFAVLEHIGSTAIPGLAAKPIIDMMAALARLADAGPLIGQLQTHGYQVAETGMRTGYSCTGRAEDGRPGFHLHIVEIASWPDRKERIMRDYLRENPGRARAYAKIKRDLARQFPEDSLAYTRAKTGFIQGLLDEVCDGSGRPRIDAWND